jgi:hypothetical protein
MSENCKKIPATQEKGPYAKSFMNLDIDIQSKRDSTIECASWQQHAVGGALKN